MRRGDDLVELTATEFELLRFLMRNPRRVLSQGADPRPGVELRLRRPGQRRRALHLLPAQEDRRRPHADDPHPARRRVPAQAAPRDAGAAARRCARGWWPPRSCCSRWRRAPDRGGDDASTLHRFLVGRLDDDLRIVQPRGWRASSDAGDRPTSARAAGDGGPPRPADALGPRRVSRRPASSSARRSRARAGRRAVPTLGVPGPDRAAPADARPVSADLGELGAYRLRRRRPGRTASCSSGLPAGPLQETVAQLLIDRARRHRRSRSSARASSEPSWSASPCGRCGGWPPPPPGSPNCRWTAARWRCAERVARGRPPHRGRPGRRGAQPDAGPRRLRAGGPAGERDAGAAVRRRRQPRAAHPAGLDPRLRRADPARREQPGRETRHALGRIESEAERMTAPGRGPAAARPARRRPPAGARARSTCTRWSSTRSATPAPRARSTAGGSNLPDEPVTVPGDAARLHQVLVNLLANARTHTPAGTTVTVAPSQRGRPAARLAVEDDGPGHPPRAAAARLRAVRPRRRLAVATAREHRARARHRRRPWWPRTAGGVGVDSVPGRTGVHGALPPPPASRSRARTAGAWHPPEPTDGRRESTIPTRRVDRPTRRVDDPTRRVDVRHRARRRGAPRVGRPHPGSIVNSARTAAASSSPDRDGPTAGHRVSTRSRQRASHRPGMSVDLPPRPPAGPSRPVLDVVIPVYNEEARPRAVRAQAARPPQRRTFPYPFRITVADNASTDAPRRRGPARRRSWRGHGASGWRRRGAGGRCARCGRRPTRRSSPTWTWTSPPTSTRCCRWWPR